jgi:hypothetical protein
MKAACHSDWPHRLDEICYPWPAFAAQGWALSSQQKASLISMIDYQAFWSGFIVLFGVLPVLAGGGMEFYWGWRNGRRGLRLVPAAVLGAGAAGLVVFAGAVLFFRA